MKNTPRKIPAGRVPAGTSHTLGQPRGETIRKPSTSSGQGQAQRPVQGQAQRPVQRPVQGQVQRPVQRPVQGQAQRPVQRPAQEGVQRPVQRSVQEKTPSQVNPQIHSARPGGGTVSRPVGTQQTRPRVAQSTGSSNARNTSKVVPRTGAVPHTTAQAKSHPAVSKQTAPKQRPGTASSNSAQARGVSYSGAKAPVRQSGSRPSTRPTQADLPQREVSLMEKLHGMIRENPRIPLFAGIGALALILLIVLISACTRSSAPDVVEDASSASTISSTDVPAADVFAAPETTAVSDEQKPEATAVPVAAYPTMIPTYQVLDGVLQTDRALGLPENTRADDSYFNDTVFIGDSVSKKLTLYVTNERKNNPTLLGNAQFLTTPSFSSRNALKPITETSLHPTYNGVKGTVEDIVAEMGVKKVYIMLGLNDVGISGIDKSVKNLFTLIENIKAKSPNVQIFIQSATPRLRGDTPTTEELFEYNMKVYEQCLSYSGRDVYFVDVAYIMRDDQGKLFEDYCSDPDGMALHFNNEACARWIDYLYTHALVQ